MESNQHSQKRNIIARFFISPAERRLRAGWRLSIHTFFWVFLTGTLYLLYLLILPSAGAPTTGLFLAETLIELIAILVATWFARRFIDRRSMRSLGLHTSNLAWKDLFVGFLIPGLLMGLIFIGEVFMGWTVIEGWVWQTVPPLDVLAGLTSGFLVFVFVGISEEILSRGYHLQNLREGLNTGWALLLSSLFFAMLHAANPSSSWTSTLGLLFAGFFLAYGWLRTGQLWLSIGLHIGWNFFEGNVFGFPVSGLPTFRMIQHTTGGPVWLTGGDFGPEAGFIVLPAMAVGMLLIRAYTRNRTIAE